MKIKNSVFNLNVSDCGFLESLRMVNDPHRMNWVLSEKYLSKHGYQAERLFGDFDITVKGKTHTSRDHPPRIEKKGESFELTYVFPEFKLIQQYDLRGESGLEWTITVESTREGEELTLEDFGVWSSFAYVMFRDKNVQKNIFNSAAIFPSISKNFTKLAVMRRTTTEPSVGLFQIEGETLSVGTHCQFENKFYENISPSLDGLLAHRLVFSGGYPNGGDEEDWIYSKQQIQLKPQEKKVWKFRIESVRSQEEFYKKALAQGHPRIRYDYLGYVGKPISFSIESRRELAYAIDYSKKGNLKEEVLVPHRVQADSSVTLIRHVAAEPGEHVMRFYFADGTEDQVVYNVFEGTRELLEERINFICENLYVDEEPFLFKPESKQGESLGKLSLIVKNNLLVGIDKEQIYKVEKSVNHYVINKWFEQGDFTHPKNLYGDFYRVMDFEYMGHLLYLLSTVPNEYLELQTNQTYLKWAAEIVELRINPEKHKDVRAREEAGMLGVFFLYINELIADLSKTLPELGQKIGRLWRNNLLNVAEDSTSRRSAMTEHYYDNAGFGPAAGALAQAGFQRGAQTYADLVLANIGFSNDFRAQNPDRWWEALTYMIHSLWGGVTAAAAYDAAIFLKDPQLMEASYRATVAVLYCYDHHANATNTLQRGEAASTFAVSGPHENRPDLSRKRFGQEIFAEDGGIFEKLFENAPSSSDWDMGEELVAYLDRFGQNAFCYFDGEGKLRGINCLIEETETTYKIESMAPYPKDIFLLNEGEWRKTLTEIKKECGVIR